VLFLAVAIGAGRIVATYEVLSETYDEGIHIAAGMELLDRGQFTWEPRHPPLARTAVALGPWLSGIRSQGMPDFWSEGRAIIHAENADRTLFLARLGVLPFFILACVMLWAWTARIAGEAEAAVAVSLFSLTPIVLAHAGVATTDMALVGTLTALWFAASRWLESPDRSTSAWLGIAGAAALTAKLSVLAHFGGTVLMVLLLRWWFARSVGDEARSEGGALTLSTNHWRGLRLAVPLCFLVVWAVYHFQMGSVGGVPVPLTSLAQGVRDVARHNDLGHASYFLGSAYSDGKLLFFPVGIAVKAPLTLLVFGIAGAFLLAGRARWTRDWRPAVPVIGAIAVLAPAIPAHINIGVRHVLPVFVVLALCGGVALVAAWRRAAATGRVVLVGLAAAGLWSTAPVHPDYLAYFNELAGPHPERILVDSDLDWGQDLRRLREALRTRGIDSVTTAYFGSAVPEMYGIPVRARWKPGASVRGWFVVSQTIRQRGPADLKNRQWILYPDALRFLDGVEPVARIGKSLLLYHVP
jgi:hypothetical protein